MKNKTTYVFLFCLWVVPLCIVVVILPVGVAATVADSLFVERRSVGTLELLTLGRQLVSGVPLDIYSSESPVEFTTNRTSSHGVPRPELGHL